MPLGTSITALMYLFLNSKLQLDRSNKLNNQGIKIQAMRAFKTYFVTKKTIKKQTGTHEIFFSHQHKYAEVFISDISKSMLFPLFWRISQSSGQINKTTKNHAVDYHSCAFRINLEYTPLIFQCPRRALSLSQISLNFLSNLYILT